jgi:hypothetical protein
MCWVDFIVSFSTHRCVSIEKQKPKRKSIENPQSKIETRKIQKSKIQKFKNSKIQTKNKKPTHNINITIQNNIIKKTKIGTNNKIQKVMTTQIMVNRAQNKNKITI